MKPTIENRIKAIEEKILPGVNLPELMIKEFTITELEEIANGNEFPKLAAFKEKHKKEINLALKGKNGL